MTNANECVRNALCTARAIGLHAYKHGLKTRCRRQGRCLTVETVQNNRENYRQTLSPDPHPRMSPAPPKAPFNFLPAHYLVTNRSWQQSVLTRNPQSHP